MSETDRAHAVAVERYPGTLADLATEVGRLRYDAGAHFLRALAAELAREAEGDRGRGRPKLAARLDALSADVAKAAHDLTAIWRLCKPHAAHELDRHPEIES